jgi:putative tricarboxylic transport membrane protein
LKPSLGDIEMRSTFRDWIIALIILLFGVFTIFFLIPMQIEVTEEYELKSLSPAFFPQVTAWIITGLSVLFMISLFRSRGHRQEAAPEITWNDEFRVMAAIGISVLYLLAFKYVGFIPASCLCLAALFWLQGIRRPLRLTILSVGTVVIVYLIFYYVMRIRFPEGLLWR